MSGSLPATPAPNSPISTTKRRRTLQSGFSLLSRAEPKIWMTGGMLVVCISMIVSLLVMIAINGLSTFWPGRIDWLMLQNNQMEIGQPQRTEIRLDAAAQLSNASPPIASSTESASSPQSGSSAETDSSKLTNAKPKPSRFYRTANFELTGQHYRWFDPIELDADGIVQPEWAILIERLSGGRMMAVPSRLSLPLHDEQDSSLLTGLSETESLLNELGSEFETLVQADTNSATTEESSVAKLKQHIEQRKSSLRSELLKEIIGKRVANDGGSLVIRTDPAGPWQVVNSAHAQAGAVIADARQVWDQPEEILKHLAPIVTKLAKERSTVHWLMHEISVLDRRLSEARVDVRQAELDTRETALAQADNVGPLVDRIVFLDRLQQRLREAKQHAQQQITDDALRATWTKLIDRYQNDNLKMAMASAEQDLQVWRQQFDKKTPQIRTAMEQLASRWREVLQQKYPIEQEIQRLRTQGAIAELNVLVPTGAASIELSSEDSDKLMAGQWNESIGQALSAAGVNVGDSPKPIVTKFNDFVSQVTLLDPATGGQSLWHASFAAPPSSNESASTNKSIWLLAAQKSVPCDQIVRIFPANRLGLLGKLSVYGQRWREFLFDEPREANTEGGVFPAIWGTIVMTLIMTLAVVPFGVIAALYLREYTRSGPIVSLVRISINNLAGVPSIVYGVFGLAFFCYSVGAFVDGGPKNAQFGILPTASWYTLLAVTVGVGVGAFMSSIFSSGPDHLRSQTAKLFARIAPWLWFASLMCALFLIIRSPFFHGFYEARLPAPTFGKEGLLWASLTLALLTLPVVIVATEEALSAVPNSLREGSLACGASKWQTIYRIVLPHARPGILTGAILAMARGIGEVAPLMLVGALPMAPDLPLDTEFPYFHGSRSFMHLGYQIYSLGFQSQNSEASKPLVFTCTLLLILIVIALNLSAILLRARLRKRFQGNQF